MIVCNRARESRLPPGHLQTKSPGAKERRAVVVADALALRPLLREAGPGAHPAGERAAALPPGGGGRATAQRLLYRRCGQQRCGPRCRRWSAAPNVFENFLFRGRHGPLRGLRLGFLFLLAAARCALREVVEQDEGDEAKNVK